MAKLIFVTILLSAALSAAYIDHAESYCILKPKEREYKRNLSALLDRGLFTLEQINTAIKTDSGSGLSAYVRAAAYDEMGKPKEAEAYLIKVKKDQGAYAKLTSNPATRLFLADIHLRLGQYDAVEALLPRLEFLLWDDRSLIDRAYYYIGMASYLQSGVMNNDFMIAAGRFEPATRIYVEHQEVSE